MSQPPSPPPPEPYRMGTRSYVRFPHSRVSQGTPKWDHLGQRVPRSRAQEGRLGGPLSQRRLSEGCRRLLLPRGASTRPSRARLPVACHRPAGHTPGAGWRLRQGRRGAFGGTKLPAKLL